MHRNNTSTPLIDLNNFSLKIIVEGMFVGILAGTLIVCYRYLLEKAFKLSKYMYSLQLKNHWLIPIWFIILIFSGWIVGTIVKKEPLVAGSGLPQVKGVLFENLNMNWWKVILGKFIGGIICIGAGLSLGRGCPSVQMGAAVGQGFSKFFKRKKTDESFLITCGASAGLSATFNVPFAGVVLVLEKIHKSYSPAIIASALSASLTADFISKQFFGLNPIFSFSKVAPMPLNSYIYLIILGVILGLSGVVFNKTLFKIETIYSNKISIHSQFKPIIAFLTAGLLGLSIPEVLGSGEGIISSIIDNSFSLKILLLLLIIKFLFTIISYGSSVPGGLFLPTLVIGALIGIVYGNIIFNLFSFNQIYIPNLIIASMAGYFAAVVKSPITACILVTEITGFSSNLLSIGLVVLIAYIVAYILILD